MMYILFINRRHNLKIPRSDDRKHWNCKSLIIITGEFAKAVRKKYRNAKLNLCILISSTQGRRCECKLSLPAIYRQFCSKYKTAYSSTIFPSCVTVYISINLPRFKRLCEGKLCSRSYDENYSIGTRIIVFKYTHVKMELSTYSAITAASVPSTSTRTEWEWP